MSPSPRLPPELISLVLSHLPLETLSELGRASAFFQALLASPVLHPYSQLLPALLLDSAPYPHQLSSLSSQSLCPPSVTLEILTLARAEWVLFDYELPQGLGEEEWEEVCRRRFLPSWCADSWRKGRAWRSLYLRSVFSLHFLPPLLSLLPKLTLFSSFRARPRTLNRLHHRLLTSSCTADEPFLRWIQLDRRGTATVNRLRSKGFDPVEVYKSIAGAQVRLACLALPCLPACSSLWFRPFLRSRDVRSSPSRP